MERYLAPGATRSGQSDAHLQLGAAKAGRAGLVKIDEVIAAGADEDSWRDEEL